MPVVVTNPMFPAQSGASPFTQAFSVELNYGQMLREVTSYNPNCDPMQAGRFINERYRQIIDRRSWYGLKVMGNITVPNIVTGGTCTATAGSTTVIGIGTNWTPAIVGLQFRQAFTQPYVTIKSVDPVAQTLELVNPYPGVSATGGFQIQAVWLTMGANIKRFLWCVNQLNGWPLTVNVNVQVINAIDPWRQSLGWAQILANRAPTPDGQLQVECWPTAYSAQTLPFEAYTQPPEMQADSDSPVAWLRSDIIVAGAVADALLFRPKQNPYYDIQSAIAVAERKEAMFKAEIAAMELADDDLDEQDVQYDFGSEASFSPNSAYGQTHDL